MSDFVKNCAVCHWFTVNTLKMVTSKVITMIVLKMEHFDLFFIWSKRDGMTNSIDPDQTAPDGAV